MTTVPVDHPLRTKSIWVDGDFVPWDQAKFHVLSAGLQYAAAIFEGIRSVQIQKKPAIFRLHEHIQRLFDSCKLYEMTLPFSLNQIMQACFDTVVENNLHDAYVRLIVFRGLGESVSVNPLHSPVHIAIVVWPWKNFLGEKTTTGVKACVSSWRRPDSNNVPLSAKATGNYLISQLLKMEATQRGFDEGIALTNTGCVCEGSTQNIFLIKNEVIYTPSEDQSILRGITRDSVLQIAQSLGFKICETAIRRDALYTADEVFFAGTSVDITPIIQIDGKIVHNGLCGPITAKLQRRYLDILHGQIPSSPYNWHFFG